MLRYKEKFGNCDIAVRKGLEEYKQLANWAGLQRVSDLYHCTLGIHTNLDTQYTFSL